MWKRLNNKPTSPRSVHIGSPTLFESSLDQDSAAKLRDLHPEQSEANAKVAPLVIPRASKERQAGGMDSAHIREQYARASGARPASSIYSQPSPNMPQPPSKLDIPRASSIYPDDVSPPDSPRTGDGARSSSPNISPITDAGSGHRIQASKSYSSNIPLPRQPPTEPTSTNVSRWREKIAAAQAAKDGKMRWDDYSGEPTSSEKGKTQSAIPGSTAFDSRGLGSSTTITSIPQPKSSIFGVTLNKPGRKEAAPSLAPQPREQWKGASGRMPIIPQVEENPSPDGTKKSFPTPSQRRQKGGFRQAIGLKSGGGRESPQDNGKKSPQQRVGRKTPTKLSDLQQSTDSGMDSSDVETPRQELTHSPLSIPPRSDSMAVFDKKLEHQSVSVPLNTIRPVPEVQEPPAAPAEPVQKRATEPVAKKPLPPASPRSTSLPTQQDFSEDQLRAAFDKMGIENEPVSRFSATTFNSVIPEETPRQSVDEPPLPPLPTESILNRKRPVPAAGAGARVKNPTRKPTPSERDSKTLPEKPPEEQAVDRVSQLEAKLTSLNRRKQNLHTVIHELTNVVQPSSVAYDNASRAEIKKTVEGLNAESAVIAKEIHETGLKLHRALKKRDDSGMFEPTGLWVRRVTG